MSKRLSKIALGLMVAGLFLMLAPAAWAVQAPADAGDSGGGTFLSSDGAKRIAAPIGAGLVIMGAAAGIGRIGGSAVESMARQPEVAGQVFTPMIVTAGLIEGAAFFALIVILIA